MRNFQATFETPKPQFISAFSICMAVPLKPILDYKVYDTSWFVFPNIKVEWLKFQLGHVTSVETLTN